jgi:hypothetical protein
MRSSPAKASVIWVPIEAIWISGAATSPVQMTYWNRPPVVILPARISRPPMTMISVPIRPTITVESAVVAEIPVIVAATFRNSLLAPRVKPSFSRRSAA